ncbi:MAG: PKD domain-containing protein [Bacteroidetes bacterium]|nr:PKD domain-containing protein [Bacteroidota bacterium]
MKVNIYAKQTAGILRNITLALVALLAVNTAQASLSGTYTINPSASASSTNYKDFTSAVGDLISGTRADGGTANGSGVSGAVTFNVAKGTYKEVVDITAITGVSSTKTITFQSASGTNTDVILIDNSATTGTVHTVHLDGAEYINFKNMTIANTSNGAHVIEVDNSSNMNSFTNNLLLMPTATANTNYPSVIYSPNGSFDTSNTFTNNYCKGGYYCVFWIGASGTPETYNVFEGNTFDSAYYLGVLLDYQNWMTFNNNTIKNIQYLYGYGMYIYYDGPGCKITNNKLNLENYMGMYFYRSAGDATNPILCANNFISNSSTYSYYGMYNYGTDYINYFHNTIYMGGTNTYSYAFMMYGTGSNIGDSVYNNNIYNNQPTNGYAVYLYNAGVDSMDYNNLYVNSSTTNLGYFNGSNCATFSDWQLTSSWDPNGQNVDPGFKSSTNLHVKAILLNGTARPRSLAGVSVLKDIDGDTRDSKNPDIGADEFFPAPNDAGVASIDSPGVGICGGKQDVYVTVSNNGTNALTSFTVNWKVNGTSQTAYSYSNATGVAVGGSIQILLGSYTFSKTSIDNIFATTTKPNGTTDANPIDDSMSRSVRSGMQGTFTIDPSKSASATNYQTFNTALADVTTRGVCGATTFNVANGTYTEQLNVTPIGGASATNMVTFQGTDSTKAILTWPFGSAAKNYTVSFNGSSWVKFNKLTISRTGFSTTTGATNGIAVEVKNSSNANWVTNSIILTNVPTSSNYYYTYYAIYSPQGSIDSGNVFKNNIIRGGGYYGIYWMGGSTTTLEPNNVFDHNLIDSAYYYGMLLYYQDGLKFTNNTVHGGMYTYSMGMYCYYGYSHIITGNKISTPGYYGMYLYNCNGVSGGDTMVVANNFLTVEGTYAFGYGIYMGYNADVIRFAYNNVLMLTPATTNSALYIGGSAGTVDILNNCLYNYGGGYAIYYSSSSLFATTNHNNLYTSGSNLGYLSGAQALLSDWQTATSQDANSISEDPGYKKMKYPYDLHITNVNLDELGTPVYGITTDIDGDKRDATLPDIGADEIKPADYDAGISLIDSPAVGFCGGTKDIWVTLQNFGKKTLTSATISWSVNGTSKTSVSWTGTLTKGSKTLVKLGSLSFTGTNQHIFARTDNPNSVKDVVPVNDSISRDANTALNGTYTIGGTSPDYTTFSSAVIALNTRGVCGAVVFNARNGAYTEQLLLGFIGGASLANTVTFQSQSGDSSKVNVDWPSTNSSSYALSLTGSSFVTFKKLTFMRSGTSTSGGSVVEFKGANNCTITNCRLIGVKDNAYNQSNTVINSTSSNDEYNTIANNKIWGGSFSVYWQGPSTANMESGNTFSGNTYDSSGYYTNYMAYQDSFKFVGNTIQNKFYSGGAALYYQYIYGPSWISKNKFILNNTTSYGLYGFYFQGNSTDSNFISNNMISCNSYYGMLLYYSDYTNLYYNSVVNNSANYTVLMYHYTTVNSLLCYNNSFVSLGGGYAIYTYQNNPTWGDYNNLYTTGSNVGSYKGTACPTLSDWQSATGFDANSITLDPKHISATNLHCKSTPLNGRGVVLNTIKDDIDGESRGTIATDIGADEFTPPNDDMSALALETPVCPTCGDSFSLISVRMRNWGINSQTSVPVGFSVKSPTGVTTTGSGTFSGTVNGGQDTSFTFTTKVNTYAGGVFSFKLWTALKGDNDITNDTFTTTGEFIPHSPKPVVTNALTCGAGLATMIAKGPAGDSVYWFTTAKGTSYFHVGDTLKQSISSNVTYWVESKPYLDSAGLVDNTTLGTSYALGNYNYDLIFDALQDMVIDSLTVYPQNNGMLQININDASGKSIAMRQFNITTSTNPYDPITVPVKLRIPKGKNYHINPVGSSVGNMYYNYYGSGYPYSYKNLNKNNKIVSITGNSLNTAIYWFFFYNWRVSTNLACVSERVPITATVGSGPKPTIKFTATASCVTSNAAFVDASTISSGAIASWKYDFGDGTSYVSTTSGTTTHKYANPGTYKVTLTVISQKACGDTLSHFITVHPTPKAKFNVSPSTVCEGGQINFVDSSKYSGGTLSYGWDFGDKTTDTKQNPSHVYTSSGSFNVRLVANSGTCTDTAYSVVNVNPVPKVAFGVTNPCAQRLTQYIDSSTIASGSIKSYSWSLGVTGITDTVKNPTYKYSKAGTYSVTLSATSDKGCTKSITKGINIDAPILSSIGATIKNANTYDFASNNTSDFYFWDFGDGSSTASSKAVTHSFSNGTYTVTLVTITSGGCPDTSKKTFTITSIDNAASSDVNISVYPNPFKESTNINYSLGKKSNVQVVVFDVMGRTVATLADGVQPSGNYNLMFNNNTAGIYMLKVTVDGKTINKQIIAVK